MPILRTETKTIPGKAFETIIIGIPATEWRKMRIKENTLNITPVLTIIIFFFGTIIFGVGYWPDIVEHYAIDLSSDQWVYTIAVVSVVTAMVLTAIIVALPIKARRIRDGLLRKHGWDGKSFYRVELSEGSAWLD